MFIISEFYLQINR